jgi:hypothetical protein
LWDNPRVGELGSSGGWGVVEDVFARGGLAPVNVGGGMGVAGGRSFVWVAAQGEAGGRSFVWVAEWGVAG